MVVPPVSLDPYIDKCDLLDGVPKWKRVKRKRDLVIMDGSNQEEEEEEEVLLLNLENT